MVALGAGRPRPGTRVAGEGWSLARGTGRCYKPSCRPPGHTALQQPRPGRVPRRLQLLNRFHHAQNIPRDDAPLHKEVVGLPVGLHTLVGHLLQHLQRENMCVCVCHVCPLPPLSCKDDNTRTHAQKRTLTSPLVCARPHSTQPFHNI